MEATTNIKAKRQINFVPFREVLLWDVKRYSSERIKSDFPIVRLGMHIQEESHKVKLFEFPDEEFGILGVNNKIGIFDAYTEKGANINQAYKKMNVGWLAYNPYRVNVGSIGMRTQEHKHEFISPAYVVFSCKETLLPDFLYKLFKTERFNKIVNESTTGSVRQNLTFDILKTLEIPLPSLNIQNALLKSYYKKVDKAFSDEQNAIQQKKQIEDFFLQELGIIKQHQINSNKGLSFIRYKTLSRWAISFITNLKSFDLSSVRYEIIPLKKAIKMFEGGKTPSTSNKSYWNGNICWTSPKDFDGFEINTTEDKITELAIKDGMKVYPEGTILGVFRSGILRHSFPVAVTKIPTAINQDIKAMDVNSESIDKRYFLFYLHTFQKLILELSSKIGVTVESINSDEFLEVPIVLPPLPIQEKIVNQITSMQKEIQSLQNLVELNRQDAITSFEQALFKTIINET